MDRYVVFGNPIAHSKSPAIHAAFAAQTRQDLVYEARLAPLEGFAQAVAEFVAAGGRGANVTVPFKEEAFRLATRLSDRAARAGLGIADLVLLQPLAQLPDPRGDVSAPLGVGGEMFSEHVCVFHGLHSWLGALPQAA